MGHHRERKGERFGVSIHGQGLPPTGVGCSLARMKRAGRVARNQEGTTRNQGLMTFGRYLWSLASLAPGPRQRLAENGRICATTSSAERETHRGTGVMGNGFTLHLAITKAPQLDDNLPAIADRGRRIAVPGRRKLRGKPLAGIRPNARRRRAVAIYSSIRDL